MSDIDRPVLQRAPVLVARRCHCGDWAGFPFGKGENQGCWKHYPYKTSSRLEAAKVAAMLERHVA